MNTAVLARHGPCSRSHGRSKILSELIPCIQRILPLLLICAVVSAPAGTAADEQKRQRFHPVTEEMKKGLSAGARRTINATAP
jgi:hypothetical protein